MWLKITGGERRKMARLLLTLLLILCSSVLAARSSHPRLRLSHKELWDLNRTRVFHGPHGALEPHTMLLDEYQERLFVGGRNALYSLSLEHVDTDSREILWPSTTTQVEECLMKGREKVECANYIKVLHQYNKTHLLACGTSAFNPMCAFIHVGHWTEGKQFQLEGTHVESGRGKCPFSPSSSCVSTFSRGELYVGLYTDYWESDGAFCRLGNSSFTRTERDDRQQLNEPKFVASAVIPDNDDAADDKVYFFFTERVVDAESGSSKVYSRIGRVCANDVGGQRMLVNKWSSFLKSRLICSVPGPNGIETHFDDLLDVFVLKKKDGRSPEVFGLFGTTSNVFKGYAVCAYGMKDIWLAFNGPYAHRELPEHHWTAFDGRVPFPRPGSCASKVNGGSFSSSRDFPDEMLRFARSHPLMYQPVRPLHRQPLLLRADGERKLRQIAVDRVEAQDGDYDVLFIGTDDGVLLKVITIYNKEADTMEEVLLEELHVFKASVPITQILVSTKRQKLYVGSNLGVAQIRAHQCDMYGSACADCCLARDPYCAWDGLTCSRFYPAGLYSKRRFRRQDVRHGNALQQCNDLQMSGEQWEKATERLVYGVEKNSTLLECRPKSPQAKVLWFRRRGAAKEEVKGNDHVVKTAHGLLFLQLRKTDSATYLCQTAEHGFAQVLVTVQLEVLEDERIQGMFSKPVNVGVPLVKESRPLPPQGSSSKMWYKEVQQLLGDSSFLGVEEYCERVWCSEKKKKKLRSLQTKWKFSPDTGRGRGEQRRPPRHVLDT